MNLSVTLENNVEELLSVRSLREVSSGLLDYSRQLHLCLLCKRRSRIHDILESRSDELDHRSKARQLSNERILPVGHCKS